jgi:hypothetical protein
MTKFEHPFAKTYRAVLKEKYPDKAASLPDDFVPAANEIQSDVLDEALKRFYADKELIIGPRVYFSPPDTAPKKEVKYTITYA